MGIRSLTLSVGTGATLDIADAVGLGFAVDGTSIANGVHCVCTSDPEYITRRQLTAKVRQPTLDAKTGVYSKDKKSISIAKPTVLTNGRVVFSSIRIEREIHPELSAAEAYELNVMGAQVCVSTDLNDFWGVGSLQ